LKLPRDISGAELAQRLRTLGNEVTRTTGRHQRLTTTLHGEHHITIPLHSPLRVGTLAAVLSEIAAHVTMSRDDLVVRLFE